MKNSLWKRDDSILRVLDERENERLVIDCVHPTMPRWVKSGRIQGYTQIEESEFLNEHSAVRNEDEIPSSVQRIIHERFTVIAGILPFLWKVILPRNIVLLGKRGFGKMEEV